MRFFEALTSLFSVNCKAFRKISEKQLTEKLIATKEAAFYAQPCITDLKPCSNSYWHVFNEWFPVHFYSKAYAFTFNSEKSKPNCHQ